MNGTYITQNTGPNREQRNAAAYGDKKSGTPDKSKGAKRMRARCNINLFNILSYKHRVNELLGRAGIKSRL